MTTWADFQRAVQATIASKRLGKPVFVRCLVQGLDKPDSIAPKLATLAATVQDWLGQPLDRVYALGSAASGHVGLTLRFREGASAMVGYLRGQPRGSGVDLMVLGNHGAIYHDAGSSNLWELPAETGVRPDPGLLAVIERALRSGKPETVRR
jgi:hypothetical protein